MNQKACWRSRNATHHRALHLWFNPREATYHRGVRGKILSEHQHYLLIWAFIPGPQLQYNMSPVLEKANCLGSVLNYPFPLFTGKTGLIEITRKAIFTVACRLWCLVLLCQLGQVWRWARAARVSSFYTPLLLFSEKAFRVFDSEP